MLPATPTPVKELVVWELRSDTPVLIVAIALVLTG